MLVLGLGCWHWFFQARHSSYFGAGHELAAAAVSIFIISPLWHYPNELNPHPCNSTETTATVCGSFKTKEQLGHPPKIPRNLPSVDRAGDGFESGLGSIWNMHRPPCPHKRDWPGNRGFSCPFESPANVTEIITISHHFLSVWLFRCGKLFGAVQSLPSHKFINTHQINLTWHMKSVRDDGIPWLMFGTLCVKVCLVMPNCD